MSVGVSHWASYHRVSPSVSAPGSLVPLQAGHCFSLTVDWSHSVRHILTIRMKTSHWINNPDKRVFHLTFRHSDPWMDCTSSSSLCCCVSFSSFSSPSPLVSPCSGTSTSAGTSVPPARDLGPNGWGKSRTQRKENMISISSIITTVKVFVALASGKYLWLGVCILRRAILASKDRWS